MPKILYVTRIYQIVLPDDRTEINAAIDDDNEHASDAGVIKDSDEAVALYISYKFDVGNFLDNVEMYDTRVRDTMPNVEEYELTEIDDEDPTGLALP
jgi:hypothetical protein